MFIVLTFLLKFSLVKVFCLSELATSTYSGIALQKPSVYAADPICTTLPTPTTG